jgi:hypothetical protein
VIVSTPSAPIQPNPDEAQGRQRVRAPLVAGLGAQQDAFKFVVTNAHGRYHDLPMPEWNDRTGVDHCAARTAQNVTSQETVVAYTVPGTWAGFNDGPPAWTAWQLP